MSTIIEQQTMNYIQAACKQYVKNDIDWEQREWELIKELYIIALTHHFDNPEEWAIKHTNNLINIIQK